MIDFIRNIIKNHFDEKDYSDLAQEAEDDVLDDFLEFDELAKKITAGLEECVLTFRPHPALNGERSKGFKVGGEYTCPTCYRAHGVWSNEVSGAIVDPKLLENGRRIILADKL